jgi:pilus assembly protein Flp/PilA
MAKSRACAAAIYVEYPRSIEIMTKLYRFLKNESGVTAIEYGLIAAGIGVAIVVIVQAVGTALVAVFTTVETNLS